VQRPLEMRCYNPNYNEKTSNGIKKRDINDLLTL